MSTICRLYDVAPDSSAKEIEAIRSCDFLLINTPQAAADGFDTIEKVHVHNHTWKGFQMAFLEKGEYIDLTYSYRCKFCVF